MVGTVRRAGKRDPGVKPVLFWEAGGDRDKLGKDTGRTGQTKFKGTENALEFLQTFAYNASKYVLGVITDDMKEQGTDGL